MAFKFVDPFEVELYKEDVYPLESEFVSAHFGDTCNILLFPT